MITRRLAYYLGLVECQHPGHPLTDCPDDALSTLRLQQAIDDLWGCYGSEHADLDPSTVETAQAVHELLWHESLDR